MHRLISIILLAVLAFPALAQPPASCTPDEALALSKEDSTIAWMARLGQLEEITLSGKWPVSPTSTWIDWMILYIEWRTVIEPTLPGCAEMIAVKSELRLAMSDYIVMLGMLRSATTVPDQTEEMLAHIRALLTARDASDVGFLAAFDALFAVQDE